MDDLTKWPRLLVVGEPVTREQANEILIRTDDWWLSTNDQAWEAAVYALAADYGRPRQPERNAEPAACSAFSKALRDWEARLGILNLHYLDNARIASSWIGGPKGWCDWDGKIGCSNYNIGKWPSIEEVTDDWTAIAEAFPYLTLHAQLVTDEGEGEVAAMWAVKGGKAALVEPIGRIAEIRDDVEGMAFRLMFDAGRERGVSVERLREALAQVASQQSGETR